MNEVTLTQAQNTDPLLNIAEGGNAFAQPERSSKFGPMVRRLGARLLLVVGLPFVGVAAESFNSEDVAYADHVCSDTEIPDYYSTVRNADGSYSSIEMCEDDEPVTTNPPVGTTPNPGTSPTQPTTPGTKPQVTTPPIVYVQLDNDGDSYQQTARQDTGEITNTGYEVDDNSVGEGDPGLAKLYAEFDARGLSFDADPDKVGFYTLVGLTVNPADFSKYIDLLANTPVTTTTVPPTTTTVPITTTTIPEPVTTEEVTESTEVTVAPSGNSSNGSSSKGGVSATEIAQAGGIAVLVAASGLTLFLVFRRHRYSHHSHAA